MVYRTEVEFRRVLFRSPPRCGKPWLAYQRLFGYQSIANRPLLLFGILLIFTGVQLITLGLLAELQSRTYHESQNKPIYVIREVREAPPTTERTAALFRA